MWWFCIFFNLVEKTLLLSDKRFVSKCGNRSHVVLCFSHSSYTANVSTDNIQRAVTLPWNAVLGKSWRFSWRSVCQRIWAGCVHSQKAQVKQVHLAHCTLNSQCLQHNDRNWTRESFNLFLWLFFFTSFWKVPQEVLGSCLCSLIQIRISGTCKGGRRRKITME